MVQQFSSVLCLSILLTVSLHTQTLASIQGSLLAAQYNNKPLDNYLLPLRMVANTYINAVEQNLHDIDCTELAREVGAFNLRSLQEFEQCRSKVTQARDFLVAIKEDESQLEVCATTLHANMQTYCDIISMALGISHDSQSFQERLDTLSLREEASSKDHYHKFAHVQETVAKAVVDFEKVIVLNCQKHAISYPSILADTYRTLHAIAELDAFAFSALAEEPDLEGRVNISFDTAALHEKEIDLLRDQLVRLTVSDIKTQLKSMAQLGLICLDEIESLFTELSNIHQQRLAMYKTAEPTELAALMIKDFSVSMHYLEGLLVRYEDLIKPLLDIINAAIHAMPLDQQRAILSMHQFKYQLGLMYDDMPLLQQAAEAGITKAVEHAVTLLQQ